MKKRNAGSSILDLKSYINPNYSGFDFEFNSGFCPSFNEIKKYEFDELDTKDYTLKSFNDKFIGSSVTNAFVSKTNKALSLNEAELAFLSLFSGVSLNSFNIDKLNNEFEMRVCRVLKIANLLSEEKFKEIKGSL